MQNLSRGLSLLELLVTVSIATLLVTMGVPYALDGYQRQQIKGAAESSYYFLRQVRSQAVSKGRNISLSFQFGPQWCIGASAVGDCDCLADDCLIDGQLQRLRYLDFNGVELGNSTFVHQSSEFDGRRGLAVGHAGRFEFANQHYRLRLVLSNLGRARLCAVGVEVFPYSLC